MNKAQVLTAYVGDGSGPANAFRPALLDVYMTIAAFQDVTDCPSGNLVPDTNLYVVEVECESGVLAQIEADSNYHVLWSSET